MSTVLTIEDVVQWLRQQNQPAMANTVERMQRQAMDDRAANQRWAQDFNALRQKYEPLRGFADDHVARGRQSD